MALEAHKIKEIYEGKVARKYDFSMPPFFATWKKKAFQASSLKNGDRVLVFCCGTGLDFVPIQEKIGKEGSIIGVDFSALMLKKAQERIEQHRWDNVELVEADITSFQGKPDEKWDVGVCTLGMSIIPEYRAAFYNLLSHVKPDGEIIIGDMQLATGWLARLNPLTIFLSKKFGGTREGHQNSLQLYALMQQELRDIQKKEFFFKAYYYCIGKV